MNDIVKNKYIRATSKEHGARIIQFLVENGGRNPYNLKGRDGFAYYITPSGHAESFKDFRPNGYTEMFLPEELNRGDLVEVSDDGESWEDRIFLADIEGTKSPFICVINIDEEAFISGREFDVAFWKYCRKVETITREEAEKQLGKRIVG